MKMYGREQEFYQLNLLKKKLTSSLVVLWGRRRIGKSRLAEEFGKTFSQSYVFQGLGPRPKQTNQDQLNHFAKKFSEQFDAPEMKFRSWEQAFTTLDKVITYAPTCVLFDEISWMGQKDKDFAGKLKVAWDTQFKKHDNLVLIVCGSVSSWIEANILNKTDFVGRISLSLRVEDLPLSYSSQFWRSLNLGTYELFLGLCLTGGVPKYLEELAVKTNWLNLLQQQCFTKNGFFVQEFDRVFSDIFGRKSKSYLKIVEALSTKSISAKSIAKQIKRPLNGKLTQALNGLCLSGYLSKERAFHFDGKPTDKVTYRLKDNFLTFYLRLILPKKDLIEKGRYKVSNFETLPEWPTFRGHQFENLIYSSLDQVFALLEIPQERVVFASPYAQKKNSKIKVGCQIDLLIYTKPSTYYVVEFKSGALTSSLANEMKLKLSALNFPKRASVHKVLICLDDTDCPNVVREAFDQVIRFQDFLSLS